MSTNIDKNLSGGTNNGWPQEEAKNADGQQNIQQQAGTAQPLAAADPGAVNKAIEHVLTQADMSSTDGVQTKAYQKDSGKPSLEGPKTRSLSDMSLEDLMSMDINALKAMAQQVMDDSTSKSMQTTAEGLKYAGAQTKAANEERNAAMLQWAKKQNEDAASQNGPFGWIISIVKMVAAAIGILLAGAAVVATAGNPLAIAGLVLAVMGMVAAVTDFASKISEAAGGPHFSLGTVIAVIFTQVFLAAGMEREKAEDIANLINGPFAVLFSLVDPSGLAPMIESAAVLIGGQSHEAAQKWAGWVAMAIAIILAIGMIVFGIASGGAGAVKALAEMGREMMGMIQHIKTGIDIATSIASTSASIDQSVRKEKILNLQGTTTELQALLTQLQSNQDLWQKDLNTKLEQAAEQMKVWAQMSQDDADTKSRIFRA